jgi:hypothetical protein
VANKTRRMVGIGHIRKCSYMCINLNAKMAQRFYNLVLLEKICDDIQTNRTFSYHLYMAFEKSLFKSGSFF